MAAKKIATTSKAPPALVAVAEEDPNHRQVRMKSHNPRAGHVLRRYIYKGMKFESGQAWKTVPLAAALYLGSVRSIFDDPNSPYAFEVKTLEEAREITAKEWQGAVMSGQIRPGDIPAHTRRDPETPRMTMKDEKGNDVPIPDPPPVNQGDLMTADLRRREDALATAGSGERRMVGLSG